MTVSTEISSNEYTGNGVTTDFDYKFRIFKANQLSVITSDADGDNVLTLRLGTDYTVTGANKSTGGKVILTRPLANGHKISIARDIPITQETSFRNQSKFFAETHEDAFDYLTMILQRIWGSLGSLYLKRPNILANWFDAKGYRIANLGKPKRDSDAVDLGTLNDEISGVNSTILKREKRLLRVDDMDIAELPKASDRAGNVLTFDKDGKPIVVAPASGSAVDVLNQLADGDGSLIGVGENQNLKEKLMENRESIDRINDRVSTVELESINPASPRNVIQYKSERSVNVMGIHFPMGGFRFLGQYYKTRVPTFSSSTFMNEVNMNTTMPFGMTIKSEQWYAVFAVANDDSEKVKFITMPYLRVDSVLNSTITLRKAAERVHASTPVEYNWDTDLLANSEVLIISEKIGNRSNAFSGRVAKITNATKQSITLDEAGGIGVNDWLLPAPNDFKYYRYCGTFYYENGEIRNFADSGSIVKNRGVFDISGTNNGAVSALEKREPSGYISPLASGIFIISQCLLSTASTGQLAENFAIDSAHVAVATDFYKASTTSISYKSAEIELAFMFGQQYFYSNSGVMASIRTQGQQNIWGWIEI